MDVERGLGFMFWGIRLLSKGVPFHLDGVNELFEEGGCGRGERERNGIWDATGRGWGKMEGEKKGGWVLCLSLSV